MKFRILILKDPHAASRGFSLQGIKIPLRDWCPRNWNDELATFNGKKLPYGRYNEFWRLSCDDLIVARPLLEKHLKRIDHLLIPIEFCDVAPVERWEECWQG